jgi:hypothetical protein
MVNHTMPLKIIISLIIVFSTPVEYADPNGTVTQVTASTLFSHCTFWECERSSIGGAVHLNSDLDHILRIFRAYELATTSLTVRIRGRRQALASNGEMEQAISSLTKIGYASRRNSLRYGQSIVLKRNCHNEGGNNLGDGLINVSSKQNIETDKAPD